MKKLVAVLLVVVGTAFLVWGMVGAELTPCSYPNPCAESPR